MGFNGAEAKLLMAQTPFTREKPVVRFEDPAAIESAITGIYRASGTTPASELRAIGLLQELDGVSVERLSEISAFEQKMDDMTLAFRQNQIWRMHEGVCSDEACILYSEMLTDFERIGDHILNIGQELASAGFPR